MRIKTLLAIVLMGAMPVVAVGVLAGNWTAMPYVLAGMLGFAMPVVLYRLSRA